MKSLVSLAGISVVGLLVAGGPASAPAFAQSPQPVRASSSAGPLLVETVASGLEHPWGLAFLPDGRMLVTERPGRLRIVSQNGQLSQPLGGLPRIAARGQGGLLDVAVDPNFAENRFIYVSYAEPRENNRSGTAVARARLNTASTGLEPAQVIFQQQPAGTTGRHFGSRLVFARDGNLFVTTATAAT